MREGGTEGLFSRSEDSVLKERDETGVVNDGCSIVAHESVPSPKIPNIPIIPIVTNHSDSKY